MKGNPGTYRKVFFLVGLCLLLALAVMPALAQDNDGAPAPEATEDVASFAPLAVLDPLAPSGDGIVPIPYAGNQTCETLGASLGRTWLEIKHDSGDSGSTTVNGITVTVTVNETDQTFDWTSTIGIDAVFAKAGNAGNLFVYDPPAEDFADTLLHGGLNPNGKYAGLSHVSFCFDYELAVEKTASASFTRTYSWSLSKEEDESFSGFAGDTLNFDYDVHVVGSQADSNWLLTGTISITNPAAFQVSISVADSATFGGGAPVAISTDCPATVSAGATVNCSYSYTGVPSALSGTNTVVVTSNTAGVAGDSDSADFTYAMNESGDSSVALTDDLYPEIGGPYSVPTDTHIDVDGSYMCSTNPDDYENGHYEADETNTAFLDGSNTDLEDSATKTFDCYLWDVSKTAGGAYNNRYRWEITKTVDPESQSGFAGETLSWEWTITWEPILVGEENHAVSGVITVTNPAPLELTVDVTDELSGGLAASVTCNDADGGTSLTIAANSSGACDYTAAPASQLAQNTATATRSGVSVSDTVNVDWVQLGDTGLDASISDTNNVDIPVDSGQPFQYTDEHTCSTDLDDYVDGGGSYTGSADNTATITWDGGEDSDDAHTAYTCYIPSISKTAAGSYNERHHWTITKDVDPTEQDAFIGETVDYDWDVVLDESVTEDGFSVTGVITVVNPNPEDDLVASLNDVLFASGVAGVIAADADCDFAAGVLTVPAGETATCGYVATPNDRTDTRNDATIAFNGVSVSFSANVSFTATVFNAVVDVVDPTDSELEQDGIVDPGDYVNGSDNDEYTCSTDLADYTDNGGTSYTHTVDNTAEVRDSENGDLLDDDDATTEITCWRPTIVKTADTTYDRDFDWTITKDGDQTELILSVGQTFLVNYDVVITKSAPIDSGHTVSGTIDVTNTHPTDDMHIVSIEDVLDLSGAVTPDCGVTFPYDLPAGGTLNCTYSTAVADATDQTNTATVIINHGQDVSVSDDAAADFGDPATVTDDCITVSDDQYGPLGAFCDSATIEYSLNVGPYEVCGEYTFVNVASFVTDDQDGEGDDTGSDDHTVIVDVPCAGCSLTPGYWKTHSDRGPAPYDDTWALLGPLQEDTIFFLSGRTYYQVLWTAPQGGNAYYILAHAYIAAQLNFLNGSDPAAAQAAFDAATVLFNTYTPAQVAALKGKAGNDLRAQFISLATTLDNYNNGLIGPGHCSEDSSSA